ncbi:hypothetical protein BD779DRAFT_1789330 [Infundibulicybe gibba]|nr:hypothetical protein BD779DRAFT_1789330 [Infundibulicybe gibba]
MMDDRRRDIELRPIRVLALLAEVGYTGLTKDDLGKLNPPDEYETGLKVMAEIRATSRFPTRHVQEDLKFVRALGPGKELLPFFISKFELGTSDSNARCAAYLAEAPLLRSARSFWVGSAGLRVYSESFINSVSSASLPSWYLAHNPLVSWRIQGTLEPFEIGLEDFNSITSGTGQLVNVL